MPLRLIADAPITDSLEYILEEKNKDKPASMYIKGPYMMAEEVNKNRRRYQLDEMSNEVGRFTNEMIKTNRSMGELEHPTNAVINSERACHLITELTQDGNVFYGKSKVLSTPMGQIVKSLILDDVKLGMSTRALGKLTETADADLVSDMKLITVDCVADPSMPSAFVNGILESKQYVLKEDGSLEEYYERFENSLKNLPKKDFDIYLREQIMEFINKIGSGSNK